MFILIIDHEIRSGKRAVERRSRRPGEGNRRERHPDPLPARPREDEGASIQDVQFILTHGEVQASSFDKLTGNWKYRFYGDDLDGGTGTVIVAIALQHKAMVITVLS